MVSSCSTGAGTGAYAGGSMGSVLGSAIGGIVGGPRGHDIGTVIGMATGAAAGAAVGDAAEKKQRQSVGVPAEEQQQRRPSEREMRARRNQRIQREKAMQRQQMQQNDAEYDDDVYFDAKKPRRLTRRSSELTMLRSLGSQKDLCRSTITRAFRRVSTSSWSAYRENKSTTRCRRNSRRRAVLTLISLSMKPIQVTTASTLKRENNKKTCNKSSGGRRPPQHATMVAL